MLPCLKGGLGDIASAEAARFSEDVEGKQNRLPSAIDAKHRHHPFLAVHNERHIVRPCSKTMVRRHPLNVTCTCFRETNDDCCDGLGWLPWEVVPSGQGGVIPDNREAHPALRCRFCSISACGTSCARPARNSSRASASSASCSGENRSPSGALSRACRTGSNGGSSRANAAIAIGYCCSYHLTKNFPDIGSSYPIKYDASVVVLVGPFERPPAKVATNRTPLREAPRQGRDQPNAPSRGPPPRSRPGERPFERPPAKVATNRTPLREAPRQGRDQPNAPSRGPTPWEITSERGHSGRW